MARARATGSREPAARVSHSSALAAAWAVLSGEAARAARHRAVVLMLLRDWVVSPQPPSGFWWVRSQWMPLSISGGREGCGEWRLARWRAKVAVAVERALLESSPSQCPSGVLAA